MASDPSHPSSSDLFSPAPYGRACSACARAKCKCFFRSEGSQCERCLRLGKSCEPSGASNKRKARTQPARAGPPQPKPEHDLDQSQPHSQSSHQRGSASYRLQERLDDLVSILRSQAADKEAHSLHGSSSHASPPSQRPTPQSAASTRDDFTPSSSSAALYSSSGGDPGLGEPVSSNNNPDVAFGEDYITYLPPATHSTGLSPILHDVAIHETPARMAHEQLDVFRRAFLPMFPFVYLPDSMSATDLRQQRPFLWLVIMALTNRSAALQFAMEETIWRIISRRVVTQHLADVDLLLGIVALATWSQYFKQDKPFMVMLTSMAVSLACDLGLHTDGGPTAPKKGRMIGGSTNNTKQQPLRTIDERRTILAVFNLTSATWGTYRKTEPLRWTPYLDECLRIVAEARETPLDAMLALQTRCQIITNQVTNPNADFWAEGISSQTGPSTVLVTAMLGQINDIRHSIPSEILATKHAQLFLLNTEITVRESFLKRPRGQQQQPPPPPPAAHTPNEQQQHNTPATTISSSSGGGTASATTSASTTLTQLRRLQDLDTLLSLIERWLASFEDLSMLDWCGVTVDLFGQFTHCLVVLFRLITIDEAGWDVVDARRRADPFAVLDRAHVFMERIPEQLGMVDADGPRRGLAFKTTHLFKAIKSLLWAEMTAGQMQALGLGGGGSVGVGVGSGQTKAVGGGGSGGGGGMVTRQQQAAFQLQQQQQQQQQQDGDEIMVAAGPPTVGSSSLGVNTLQSPPDSSNSVGCGDGGAVTADLAGMGVDASAGGAFPLGGMNVLDPDEFLLDFSTEPWWLSEVLETHWLPQGYAG